MRVANGVPEMPYGYWKIAQLIPDYGPQFLVAIDLQDWTDEQMRLFASDDEEFRKASLEHDKHSFRKEMREAERVRRECKMSDDEFIDGGWEFGGEEGKRGVIWKVPAHPDRGKKAKASPRR
ncbi:hypothetical protein SAMN05444161_6796 [Rhizobiales bacterium GAS191]|nr:hypothetical protein SAMN05444161_6796 [Rhizobiales bacterium GAS191]